MQVTTQLSFELDDDPSWEVDELRFVESLSQPYSYTVLLERSTPEPFSSDDATAALGANCTLFIDSGSGVREVHGKLLGLTRLSNTKGELRIRARVAPALALAAHTHHSRTYSERSIKDVVDELLTKHLGARQRSHRWTTRAHYPVRELLVQYKESDLAFIQRLLERVGITYHFTTDTNEDTGTEVMILDDEGASFHPVMVAEPLATGDYGEPIVTFVEHDASVEGLLEFHDDMQLSIDAVDRRVYDWESPDLVPDAARVEVSANLSVDQSDSWRRETPAEAGPKPVLERAQLELRRYQQQRWVARGRSTVPGFAPGRLFHVEGYGSFLLTKVEHLGVRSDASLSADYTNHFECVKLDAERPQPKRYVPLRRTPRPRMTGPHTALVVGSDGSDMADQPQIHTDAKSRVKVRFHWEREADDDGVHAWLRVAQTWSGPAYGFVFVPRVGMEVVVEFVDGNPDAPLLVGCVYDDRQVVSPDSEMLQESETRSWIRTLSEDGVGFNEILFDDAQGHEFVHVRAQKNRHDETLHDETIDVGHDQTVSIGSNQTQTIGADLRQSVGRNKSVDVGGSQSTSVGADQRTTVSGSVTTSSGGAYSVAAGADLSVSSAGDLSIRGESAGTMTMTNVFVLQCGSSSITLAPEKITIAADEILVTAKGDSVVKGAMVKLNP